MEEFEQLTISTDPLLACCFCRRLLRDATQLTCLHNCCRQCFSTAASNSSHNVACGSCGTITRAGTERTNSFIEIDAQRSTSINKSVVCAVCKENGEPDEPAVAYCSACRHSLCGSCIDIHDQYYRQHSAQPLAELNSLEEVFPQLSASACLIHQKPLDVTCIKCEKVMCIKCSAECIENQHKMGVVGEESFDSFVGTFIAAISALENECVRKSEILKKPGNALQITKVARDRHLQEIAQRKVRIVHAVELSYQEIELSTRNAYDGLETELNAAAACSERIASNLLDARNYINRLVHSNNKCEIVNQQMVVRQRLNVLSTELDTLSNKLATNMKAVKVDSSLPDDLENVIKAWIGIPHLHSVIDADEFSWRRMKEEEDDKVEDYKKKKETMSRRRRKEIAARVSRNRQGTKLSSTAEEQAMQRQRFVSQPPARNGGAGLFGQYLGTSGATSDESYYYHTGKARQEW